MAKKKKKNIQTYRNTSIDPIRCDPFVDSINYASSHRGERTNMNQKRIKIESKRNRNRIEIVASKGDQCRTLLTVTSSFHFSCGNGNASGNGSGNEVWIRSDLKMPMAPTTFESNNGLCKKQTVNHQPMLHFSA